MTYITILIILALAAALIVTALGQRKKTESHTTNSDDKKDDRPDDCCGAHEVCESDTLLSSSDAIEYYNDDELDIYKGRNTDNYSDAEIEEFREVLYTLKEREVAGWLKSLQLREVQPPAIVREEALMIVAERRMGIS